MRNHTWMLEYINKAGENNLCGSHNTRKEARRVKKMMKSEYPELKYRVSKFVRETHALRIKHKYKGVSPFCNSGGGI